MYHKKQVKGRTFGRQANIAQMTPGSQELSAAAQFS